MVKLGNECPQRDKIITAVVMRYQTLLQFAANIPEFTDARPCPPEHFHETQNVCNFCKTKPGNSFPDGLFRKIESRGRITETTTLSHFTHRLFIVACGTNAAENSSAPLTRPSCIPPAQYRKPERPPEQLRSDGCHYPFPPNRVNTYIFKNPINRFLC